jgi:hypothetical protein
VVKLTVYSPTGYFDKLIRELDELGRNRDFDGVRLKAVEAIDHANMTYKEQKISYTICEGWLNAVGRKLFVLLFEKN